MAAGTLVSSEGISAAVVVAALIAGLGVAVPTVVCWRKHKKGLAALGAFTFLSFITGSYADDPSGYGAVFLLLSPVVYVGAIRGPKEPGQANWLVWMGLWGLALYPATPIVWFLARRELRLIREGRRPNSGRHNAEIAKRLGFWGLVFWLGIAAAGFLFFDLSIGA